ncbi:hypothetical protein [Streptomyces sp. NPDC048659]|uniref:hypothetical protein n=1 Tax=Streptomyces sp. NPDC048659 TaxID=3155489 RepID=UPI00342741D9
MPGDNLNEPRHRLLLGQSRRDHNRAVAVREGTTATEFDVHVEKDDSSVLPVPGNQNGAAATC